MEIIVITTTFIFLICLSIIERLSKIYFIHPIFEFGIPFAKRRIPIRTSNFTLPNIKRKRLKLDEAFVKIISKEKLYFRSKIYFLNHLRLRTHLPYNAIGKIEKGEFVVVGNLPISPILLLIWIFLSALYLLFIVFNLGLLNNLGIFLFTALVLALPFYYSYLMSKERFEKSYKEVISFLAETKKTT